MSAAATRTGPVLFLRAVFMGKTGVLNVNTAPPCLGEAIPHGWPRAAPLIIAYWRPRGRSLKAREGLRHEGTRRSNWKFPGNPHSQGAPGANRLARAGR